MDFTPLAQRLPPAEMVGILDQLFSHFDALVERHGLEKIKTIGDCYMAAAGVPIRSRTTHARLRSWRWTCETRLRPRRSPASLGSS